MAAARMVWHDWFVEALAGWLDDIHVLCLGAATRALQQLVTDLVRQNGPAMRKRGPWRPRGDQRGVWKLLRVGDIPHLPDLKIRMQSEWIFTSRDIIKLFLDQAAWLHARDGLNDWIVFCAVTLQVNRKPRPSRGTDGFDLADSRIRVKMQHAVYDIVLYLNDMTPTADEATIALQMSVRGPEDDGSDDIDDIIELHALSPAEPSFSYPRSPVLRRTTWERLFDSNYSEPFPLLFGVYFQ